jgi:cyclopropane fatty-acyl-phospholipid synthase-like methyltransferase
MEGQDWDRKVRGHEAFRHAYDSTPPWDIGRPQPAIVAAADSGWIRGHVLDAGCGTGEHALLAAGRGLSATGVDVVPEAIAIAERKAAERGLDAQFLVGDMLEADDLVRGVDTVIDVGFFHVLDDEDRARYRDMLRRLVATGGNLVLLCFSDRVPGDAGPRRISAKEIRECFADGWRIESLDEAALDVAYGPVDSVHAWRAVIGRV